MCGTCKEHNKKGPCPACGDDPCTCPKENCSCCDHGDCDGSCCK